MNQSTFTRGFKRWTNHQLNKSAKSFFSRWKKSFELPPFVGFYNVSLIFCRKKLHCLLFFVKVFCTHIFKVLQLQPKRLEEVTIATLNQVLYSRRFVSFMLAQSIYGWIGVMESWSLTEDIWVGIFGCERYKSTFQCISLPPYKVDMSLTTLDLSKHVWLLSFTVQLVTSWMISSNLKPSCF